MQEGGCKVGEETWNKVMRKGWRGKRGGKEGRTLASIFVIKTINFKFRGSDEKDLFISP